MLAVKIAELKEVEDKLAALQANMEEQQAKEEELNREMAVCTVKLDRANILTDSLSSE